ncbi:MAG: hypothetical protein CVU71_13595 [Deltaproteobacteria bacterium HGW-Deltaproteobacteria-6]|jgi:hypothetical protein|nr:MAG: hypothetical protein CVU71_13595 [Deltaproteobacteria bacterium HGW-Deltaproteobacteria-6]PKN96580.1 MAG: hypothetical protein CVU43_19950 [Chloroflexi bacterium HGW-Chloroflexi-5]
MKYNFDRSKPFYPLVMSYLAQLHGLKEICAIGAIAVANGKRDFTIPSHCNDTRNDIETGIKSLLSPLNLAVTGDTEKLDVSIEFVAKEMALNHGYLLPFQARAASACLAMAHEITKYNACRTNEKKWEFLRHCRNAISHNAKWHFLNKEPINEAEWRGIKLEAKMHGEPLFVQADGTGNLKLGDPIALLWDIESEYPNMTV